MPENIGAIDHIRRVPCIGWANLKGSNASLTAGIFPYTKQTKIDGIGLFAGQVGYAFDNVLWYVKGGAAVTDNHYSSFFTASGVVFNQADETRGAVPWERELSSHLRRTGRWASWAPKASRFQLNQR